jgi:hypothetical protein
MFEEAVVVPVLVAAIAVVAAAPSCAWPNPGERLPSSARPAVVALNSAVPARRTVRSETRRAIARARCRSIIMVSASLKRC